MWRDAAIDTANSSSSPFAVAVRLLSSTFQPNVDERSSTRYEYDERGRLAGLAADRGGDGMAVETFRYDSAGRLIERVVMDPADGRVFTVIEYRYGSTGAIEGIAFVDPDADPSLEIDLDVDGDGDFDAEDLAGFDRVFTRIDFVRDAEGRVGVVEIDEDDSGSVDETRRHAYDERGNMVRRTIEGPDRGVFSQVDYVYASAGEPVHNFWRFFLDVLP